jgi:hypothetical protein
MIFCHYLGEFTYIAKNFARFILLKGQNFIMLKRQNAVNKSLHAINQLCAGAS